MTLEENIRPDDETLASTEVPAPLDAEYRDIAAKLYQEEFVLIVPEEYTQFLAALDPESAIIRQHYMDMFEWNANLLALTRMLCRKLYLKGESQEIDRILSAFTKLYLKQHPANAFCTTEFEQIYIVLYSLILLNTALHNLEVKKSLRISQADYIRNTLATFLQQNGKSPRPLLVRQKIRIERELHQYYDDLARAELYLKRAAPLAPALPKPRRNTNRYSVAETIMSGYSHTSDQSHSHDHEPRNGTAHHDHDHRNGSHPEMADTDAHSVGSVAESSGSVEGETHVLARQRSGSSYWSTADDGSRRPLLAMRRTASGAPTAPSARFGFTRALYSDAAGARAAPMGTLRNYRSLEYLGHPTALSRSPSHGLIADDPHQLPHTSHHHSHSHSHHPDDMSVLTVDAPDSLALDLDPRRTTNLNLEDFDVDDYQDRYDLTLELKGAPYLKEGLLKLRILHNDMADFSTTSDLAVLLLLALSIQSTTARSGGLFSMFSRPFARAAEPAPPLHVGTGTGSGLFSHKLTEFFVVVSKGELRLYSFDPKVVKKQQTRMKKLHLDNALAEVGDGNWLKNAANVGNYNLCATVAAREDKPDRHADPTKYYWSLTFPKVTKHQPKKFVFEAGTVEVAAEFIDTCNFWASKISAVPTLEESMSSIEYGWNDVARLQRMGDSFKRTKDISKYEVIPKGVYLSNYIVTEADDDELAHDGLLKQFIQTVRYYNNLKLLYNRFSKTKAAFVKHFRKYSRSAAYKLVLANYEVRATEYKEELIKYKSYLTMLGHGLKLRFDLEEQDVIADWDAELHESEPPLNDDSIAQELGRRLAERLAAESNLVKAVRIELAKRLTGAASVVHPITAADSDPNAPLVKSPKTFSFTNIKDFEVSPISQLLSVDSKAPELELLPVKKELIASFSTNTITEEEEPEEESEGTKDA